LAEVASAPAPFCEERRRLTDAFVAAVSEYLRMHSARVAAITRGDEVLFEEEIDTARKRKNEAMELVRAHQREHGC